MLADDVLPKGVPSTWQLGNGPHHLRVVPERDMGMSMNLADLVSSGTYSGMCVSTGPVAEPTVMSLAVPCCVVACGFVA